MVACPSLKYDGLSVYWCISALYMDFAFDQPRSTMKVGIFFHAMKDLSPVTVLCFATDVFRQRMTATTMKGIVFSADPVI